MQRLRHYAQQITPATAVGGALLMGLVVMAITRSLSDPDLWWHLWSGEWMIEHGEILRRDLLTFTGQGEPYVAHSWLAEVLLAAVADGLGLPLLLVLRGLLLGTTYALLARVMLTRSPERQQLLGWGLVVLAVFTGAASLAVRPYLFSYALLVVTLLLVERTDEWRWTLVPLFAIWVNLHGLWLLGLGIIGLKALERIVETRRLTNRWTAVGLGCAVATLANPFGWRLHMQLLELSGTMKAVQVLEWRTIDFSGLTHWAFALLALLTLALLWRSRRRVRVFDAGLALVAIGLGVYAVRNLAPSAILLVFVAAPYLHREADRGAADDRNRVFPAIALGVAVAVLSLVAWARVPRSADLAMLTGDELPVTLVQQLEPGRVFALDAWGGIVSYVHWPDVLVAYDTRIDFHGAAAFDQYWDLVLAEGDASFWLEDRCVDQVLGLDTWPLTEFLEERPHWEITGIEELRDRRNAILLTRTQPSCPVPPRNGR